jgi:hypothetical protein
MEVEPTKERKRKLELEKKVVEPKKQKKEDVVKHFDVSECVKLIDYMGSDHRVVNAARVSFGASISEDEPLTERDKGIIKYMAKHHHESPFFHPIVTLWITMPIFTGKLVSLVCSSDFKQPEKCLDIMWVLLVMKNLADT